MSALGVQASHQAWLRIKRRAAGGAVKGYDAGGAPDLPAFDPDNIAPLDPQGRPHLTVTPDQTVQGSFSQPGDDQLQPTEVGFHPLNPMNPTYSNPGGHADQINPQNPAAINPSRAAPTPPQGLDNLTVNSILHPDTPVQAGRTRSVEEIAADLHARGQDALTQMGVPGGRIEEPHPEHDEIISHAMASEAQAALNRPGANAADWYTGKVREAMAVASTMHPEIENDPIAKMAYTAALAITSQGETVPSNVRLAEQAYRHFKENGRFPEQVQADSGKAMGGNFAKLNDLLDTVGPQGTLDFLHQPMKARDLKALGHASATKELMDADVHGSLMLGPKIGGGFYQNLNGNYDPVTMDLWFMRNWGRLTGTLVGKQDIAPQKARLVSALQDAGAKVPRTQDGLLDAANTAVTAHEQDFRANRADYDSGAKAKSELTYAAERYQKALQGINETPSSGGQRAWMRDRVSRARDILEQTGTKVTNADLQAILWYPEKELYGKLGGRPTEATNVDYASALRNVAKTNGVPDDAVERAVSAAHQRSGPAGASDDSGGTRALPPGSEGAPAASPAGRGAVGGRSLEEAQGAAARLAAGRAPLAGLPQGPLTLGGEPHVPGPNAAIHDAAEDYARSAGLKYEPPQTYQKVDKDRAGRIAQAFEQMKHAPNDPAVKASYDAMINETLAQFQALKKLGLKIEFIKGNKDPYAESPRLAAKDVAENNHLWVFPTETGFGTGTSRAAEAMKNNPLLRPTNEVIDGHRLLANDVFRIVHDVFGHLKDGNGFRADGEENAWRSHSAMYSDLARPAMTSETRGQNSWLNYGPHGATNRTAKSADTIYADQKVGLLPRWASEEGRRDAAAKGAPGADFLVNKYSRAAAPMRASGGRVNHDEAASRAHPEPTAAQIENGNYRKGHTNVHGIPIAIENARGSIRRGIHNGENWEVVMPAHYGYAKGTNGADGDEVDCYIGKHPASRKVFVINQRDADTKAFDEHKVMLCYASKDQALRDYEKAFSDGKGKDRIGGVVEMSIEDFKKRLKEPKAFAKSIKRAAGGRIGYADGGGPDDGWTPVTPDDGWTPVEHGIFHHEPPTPGQGFGSFALQGIPETLSNAGKFAGAIGSGIWNAAKGTYETARGLGAGEIDPSTPEGSLKAVETAASVLPMSPAMRTGRAIAEAAAPAVRAADPAAVNAEALARQKAADEFNVNLSRGQATQNPDEIRYEDLASRGAYGPGAQAVAAPFFEQQFQDVGQAGRGVGEGLARDQNIAGTPQEAASTLGGEVSTVASRAQQLRDQAAAQATRDAEATRATVRDNERVIGESVQGGAPAIENPREAGEVVGQQLRSRAAIDRAAYQGRYTEALGMEGQFQPDAFRGMGNRVQGQLTMGDEPVFIDDVTTPLASRAIRDLDNISNLKIQNRADPFGREAMPGQFDPVTPAAMPVDLRGVDQARKRLVAFYRAARGSGNAADARAAGSVIDAFDDQIENAMSNGLFSGDPRALDALREARATYAQYQRNYRPRQAGDDVGTAMRRIIDRQATPEEIANMVTGSGRLGNAGLPVRLADRLEQVLGTGSDAWSAVRQAIWQRASQVRNAAGVVDPARSAQSILDFTGSSLGQRMFSPAERAAMRTHAQGVRNLDQIIEQMPSTQAAARAQTLYESAFGGAGIGGAQQATFRRLVDGTAAPDEIVQSVFNSIAGGKSGNTVRLIDAIERITGPQSEAMAAVRQGVWQKLTQRAAGMDQPGQQKLAQSINGFLGSSVSKRLYSDSERFLMKRYADVVKDTGIPRTARTGSDTTPGMMSVASKYAAAITASIAGAAAEGMVGVHTGGLLGAGAGLGVAKAIGAIKNVASARTASRQFNWLNGAPREPVPAAAPQSRITAQGTRLLPAMIAPRQLPPPGGGVLRQLTGPTPAGAQGNQQQ